MPNFRIKFSGSGSAGDIWNFGWYCSSSASLTSVNSAAVAWGVTVIKDYLGPLWSPEQQADGLVVDELASGSHFNSAQKRNTFTWKGTSTDPTPDPRACVVVGVRTDLPTRSGRGRFYVPALADAASYEDTGLLTTTAAMGLSSAVEGAFSTFSTTGQLGIFHKPTATMTAASAITVGVVLGTQRRRTNKVPQDYQRSNL